MRQDERHHTSDDIFVGIDLATRQHQVVVVDAQGQRLTSFKVPHSREGLHELVERCTSRRVCRGRGRVRFAFEATGHVWEAVGAFFEQQGLRYQVVNPLATFRVRAGGEQWVINKAIHYNEWVSFTKQEFRAVVEAFKSLLLQFRCPKADCESWLYVTPRKTNPEILRCRCMRINLNLKLK